MLVFGCKLSRMSPHVDKSKLGSFVSLLGFKFIQTTWFDFENET